jgi:hypothetical protein
MQEDLSCFCCLNEDCPDHGRRGAGNLTVCASYGKLKQRRMLYCRSCKARSSEHKGTPLIGSRLTEGQALSIFRKKGVRSRFSNSVPAPFVRAATRGADDHPEVRAGGD